jgi:hypothetical protein
VECPKEEVAVKERGERSIDQQDTTNWIECDEDEENQSDYHYKYVEDKEKMILKKYKRKAEENLDKGPTVVKDPISYKEWVFWFPNATDKPQEKESVTDRLMAMENVVPMGYAMEQFLHYLKTDVNKKVAENHLHNKQQIARIKREAREKNEEIDPSSLEPYQVSKDMGMVQMKGLDTYHEFVLKGISGVQSNAKVTDALFNHFRGILKDGCEMKIRHEQQHPVPGSRGKTRIVGSEDPPQFLNQGGYNPSLERRIEYKCVQMPGSKQAQLVNVNYLLQLQEFEVAKRCDVAKAETAKHLANKPIENPPKDIEFTNEASFRFVKKVMLRAKFSQISDDRGRADEKEVRRMQKAFDHEQKDKQRAVKIQSIANKGINETFEEKSAVKLTRGPFHNLESIDGLKTDNFLTCEY